MSRFSPESTSSGQLTEERITSIKQLLAAGNCLIHGDDMSGKTALVKRLFLHLVGESDPALFIDLKDMHGLPNDRALQDVYGREFNGDYNLWKKKPNKTVILALVSQELVQ